MGKTGVIMLGKGFQNRLKADPHVRDGLEPHYDASDENANQTRQKQAAIPSMY